MQRKYKGNTKEIQRKYKGNTKEVQRQKVKFKQMRIQMEYE